MKEGRSTALWKTVIDSKKEAGPVKILGKDVETHPEVPAPLPFRKFMVDIGLAMMTIALGLVSFFGKAS